MDKGKRSYQSLDSREREESVSEGDPSKKKKIIVLGILSLVVVIAVVLTLVFTLKSEGSPSLQ